MLRHVQRSFTVALVIAGLGIVIPQSSFAQTDSTWNGSVGNWNDVSRWSTDPFFPDNGNGAPSYVASIAAGNVNLNVPVVLDGLTLSGGALSGTGNLTTTNLTLSGSTLATSGVLQATNVALTSGQLNRNLTLSTAGVNSITEIGLGSGITLTNPAGATLTATTFGASEKQCNGPGTFVNQGTFTKSGTARFYLSMPLNNSGLIQVQQSSLRIDGTGNHTGQFDTLFGSQLEISGIQNFSASSSITGTGDIFLTNSTATMSGSVTGGLFRMLNSTLAGSGSLTPTKFFFESGTLSRNLTLQPTAIHDIGNLGIATGRTLTNPVGTTLMAATGAGEEQSFGPGSFLNQGTFIKTGGARYYLSMPMTNSGMIQVQQSALRLDGTGTHTGMFDTSFGATLELAGTQTLTAASNVSGAGDLLLINATATLNGPVSTGLLQMRNSTLAGSGNLTPDIFFFESGTLSRNLILPAGTHDIGNLGIAVTRTLTNPAGTTLMATTAVGEEQSFGPGTFLNQGNFVKSGGARYYLSMPMTNSGSIQVQQSALRMDGGGTHTGTFDVFFNSALELKGLQTLTPASSVFGLGELLLIDGTASLNGPVQTGSLRMLNSTLAGTGDLQPERYVFDSGTLSRDLTLTLGTHDIGNLGITATRTLTNPVGATLTAVTAVGEEQSFGPGTFLNQGTFTKSGNARYYLSMPISNSGLIQVQQTELRLDGTGTHTGMFEIADFATLEFGGTQTLQGASSITGGGSIIKVGTGTLELGGSSSFTGGATVQGGTLRIVGDQAYSGPTDVQFGATLELQGDLSGGTPVTISAGGTLSGNGAIGGLGASLVNSGMIQPGLSPGSIQLDGDFTQTAAGSYVVEIAGPTSHDLLDATGTATLAGSLYVFRLGGFVPQPGDVFNILDYGAASGTFTNIIGSVFGPGPGEFLQPLYLTDHLSLYAPLLGDANFDGVVSGGDFTIWADHFGATGATWTDGDFTGDGLVTGGDFTIWADHFGEGVSLDSIQHPVPEPSAVWLACAAMVGIAQFLKRARLESRGMTRSRSDSWSESTAASGSTSGGLGDIAR